MKTNPNKLENDENAERTPGNILRRRKERNSKRGNKEIADWQSVDSESIVKLIAIVTANRGTITFGYTKDAGAYYLSYYVDGESEKLYVRPTEDIDARLADELEDWQ